MVEVTVLTGLSAGGQMYAAGEVANVPDEQVARLVRLGVVACCALASWRFVLRPGAYEPMAFVAFCRGPCFVFSKVFHNDSLVWWLPVVGVVLARALTAPREASRPATAPAASSTPAG